MRQPTVRGTRIRASKKSTRLRVRAGKVSNRGADSKKTALKIAFLNVDHLSRPTFFDVVSTVQKEQPDIVFLFETYRTQEDCHEDISLQEYTKYETLRSEVAEDRQGGGHCCLLQDF